MDNHYMTAFMRSGHSLAEAYLERQHREHLRQASHVYSASANHFIRVGNWLWMFAPEAVASWEVAVKEADATEI